VAFFCVYFKVLNCYRKDHHYGSIQGLHSVAHRPRGDLRHPAIRKVDEYFRGARKKFSLKLLPQGTPFQKLVWQQLKRIPYGKVVSYGDVARAIGKPHAFRAVGNANNKNPIGIIIPCHRVIGSDGKLVGYGSGIWRKEWLLKHEKSE
jgi:methylated-DNA-[protein]-cysteine S-methyltransferase